MDAITEKKRMEEQIEDLYNEFEAILDSSQDGIHITDGSGVTVWFNKACERIDNVKKEHIWQLL